MKQAAIDYICEGFGALPIKADKLPMLPMGHPYLYSLIPEESIDTLFGKPNKIAIACGAVSSGFMALDFDKHQGQDAQSIFNAFMENDKVRVIVENYQLPIYQTPSGGFHIYFKSETKNRPGFHLSKWADTTVMIEVRGHGQYIIVDPSPGYSHIVGSEILKVATISDDEVDTLLDVARSFNQCITIPSTEKKTGGKWPEKFDTDFAIGKFNENEIEYTKGVLIEHGWAFIKVRPDGIEYWRRPGKEDGFSATIGAKHNMFYNFSSSATPFIEWQSYTFFDVVMLLNHDGDFDKANDFVKDRYKPTPTPRREVELRLKESNSCEEQEQVKELTPFPFNLIPESILELVNGICTEQNLEPDIVFMEMLLAAGVANGNCFKIKIHDGWLAPSSIWVAIVGPSGAAKSGHINIIDSPIKVVARKEFERYTAQINTYNALAAKEKRKSKRPEAYVIATDDTTVPGLTRFMSENKQGMVILSGEGTGWIGNMNRNPNAPERPFYLKSFDNKDNPVLRAGDGISYVYDTFLSVCIGIQEAKLGEIFGGSSDADGFADRFLFLRLPQKLKIWTNQHSDLHFSILWKNKFVKSIDELRRFFLDGGTKYICLENNVKKYRLDVMNGWEREKFTNITDAEIGFISKYVTYLDRLALCLSMLRMVLKSDWNDIEITLDDYKLSAALLEWQRDLKSQLFREALTQKELSNLHEGSKRFKSRDEQVIDLFVKGFKQADIARQLGMNQSHVSRAIKSRKK